MATVRRLVPRSGATPFLDVRAMLESLRPDTPVTCVRPHMLRAQAQRFVTGFPGDVMFAVKCNPDRAVLKELRAGGIAHFDTASLGEIELTRAALGGVACHFMHPVKSRSAIRAAYEKHGLRTFVVDHGDELAKLAAELPQADDLLVVVRLAVGQEHALYALGGKFGADVQQTAALLRATAARGWRCGISFHVGSQNTDPQAWVAAIAQAAVARDLADVPLALLDVGGGFPVRYPGVDCPALEVFFDIIGDAVAAHGFGGETRLACEPGRALVCEAVSVVTKVELRRGDALYLNDGVFGNLSELNYLKLAFPMRVFRQLDGVVQQVSGGAERDFSLFGPTCDSVDSMAGPYALPSDMQEGDWIEIGQMGSYGLALRTRFNGFSADQLVTVQDVPPLPVQVIAVQAAILRRAA
jgi:ornithine decarboxylase